MSNKIRLHVPEFDELWYREKLLLDSSTMSYNRGYDLTFPGYDRSTGCIAFPRDKWESWYSFFIENEPDRYYAYIELTDSGQFIGEVNLHRPAGSHSHDMGIVIDSAYRGKGYAAPALRLLLSEAFERCCSKEVCNEFESERISAIKAHLAAGFKITDEQGSMTRLAITRGDYIKNITNCI